MNSRTQRTIAKHPHYLTGLYIIIGGGLGVVVHFLYRQFGGPDFLRNIDLFIGAGLGAAVAFTMRLRQRLSRA